MSVCCGIVTSAGCTYHASSQPPTATRAPPRTSPPCARAAASACCIASNAARSISGPTSTPASRGSPITSDERARSSRARSSSWIAACAIPRRVVVQRWPAVPQAPKTMPRTARSRSAEGATTTALLPPSSSRQRPNRAATLGPTARPIRVDPVDDSSATRGSSTSRAPTSAGPISTCASAAGASAPKRCRARSNSAWVASAASGVFSLGFQTTALPHTSASAAFQAQTATGKLNAVTTPTTPSGCHCSIIRCPGRSLAIVSPCSWRDRPTAKSQMSIISWTSPSPSLSILPTSSVTSAASAGLCARSSSANRRTSSPRRGAGMSRQRKNASRALPIAASAAAALISWTCASTAPSIGERTGRLPWRSAAAATPSAARSSGAVGMAHSGDRLDLPQLLVGAAETVGEERGQLYLFLADEAAAGKPSLAEQVDRGADAGRGGDLDRRHRHFAVAVGEDLAGEHLLHQHAVAHAARGDEHQHHVLHRRRHRAAQDRHERALVAREPEVVEQHLHQRAVAGVAHAFVIERAHPAGERLAQRPQPARGVERLVLDAVEREMLEPLERQRFDTPAVVDRLAGMAVLVDQAVDAPRQVVFQRIGRERRQRTDAHLQLMQFVEAAREVVRDDADEAGGEPALRHERGRCALGECLDRARGRDVLGEVEIVAADLACERRQRHRAVIRQRVDDRIVTAFGAQGVEQRARVAVDHRDTVIAAAAERAGDGLADVAGTEQGDAHGFSGTDVENRSLAPVADERNCSFVDMRDNPVASSARFAALIRDQTDRDLLALLQANARESTASLARKLRVARTTVVARLAQLEREGVIVGYTVRLGLDEREPRVMAHVGIVHEPQRGRDVMRQMQKMPELLQLLSVSGQFDYIAIMRAESTERLDALLDQIGAIEGVIRTTTSVVLGVRIRSEAHV